MILVIDVSNTNMVFGVFEGKTLKASWRLSTQSGRTSDETGLMIRSLFEYSEVSVGEVKAVVVYRWIAPGCRCILQREGAWRTGLPAARLTVTAQTPGS